MKKINETRKEKRCRGGKIISGRYRNYEKEMECSKVGGCVKKKGKTNRKRNKNGGEKKKKKSEAKYKRKMLLRQKSKQ